MDLDTLALVTCPPGHLSLLQVKMGLGSWVWVQLDVWQRRLLVAVLNKSSEQTPNCAYLSWRYGFTKLASAGTKMTDRPTERDRQRQTDRAPRALRLDRADLRVGNLAASSVLPVRGARDDSAL